MLRVLYPSLVDAGLPKVRYQNVALQAVDISVGGCCLHAPDWGWHPRVGEHTLLDLQFSDHSNRVQVRIVAEVHERLHIQFLDLSEAGQARIRESMRMGARGMDFKPSLRGDPDGPSFLAEEMLYSSGGDSLVFFPFPHSVIELTLDGEIFSWTPTTWPLRKSSGKPMSEPQVDGLILLLANIRSPSPRVLTCLLDLQVRRRQGLAHGDR